MVCIKTLYSTDMTAGFKTVGPLELMIVDVGNADFYEIIFPKQLCDHIETYVYCVRYIRCRTKNQLINYMTTVVGEEQANIIYNKIIPNKITEDEYFLEGED